MSQYTASEWEAEWAAAAKPRGAVINVRVTLADASREGRAKVAGCRPQPTEPRATMCSISRGRPRVTSPTGRRRSPAAPTAGRGQSPAAARAAAVRRAETEQWETINRFRPFVQVAAVSAAPRNSGPDPFGLGRHLASNRRVGLPREDPEIVERMMTNRRH